MGEYQHKNPWAEKLLQVSLPDSGEAWQAMESRLDQQMPRWWNRDSRRWVLLILLLLLLIGVCNCPGSRRLFHNSATRVHEPAATAPAPTTPAPTSANPASATPAPTAITQGSTTPAPAAQSSARIIPGPTPPARRAVPGNGNGKQPPVTGRATSSTPVQLSTPNPKTPSAPNSTKPSTSARSSAPAGRSSTARRSAPAKQPMPSSPLSAEPAAAAKYPGASSGVRPPHRNHNRQRRQDNAAGPITPSRTTTPPGSAIPHDAATPPNTTTPPGTATTPGQTTPPGSATPSETITQPGTAASPGTHKPPGTHAGDPVQTPSLVKDSAGKKGKPAPAKPPVPPKQAEQKEKENGLMAAIGLNQFFPLGGQQSVYSSDGTSSTLSDYLPVPVLRYYFNRKLYIQLEAQFNTPQATKKNLVISSPPPDTSTIQGRRIESSATVRQLFYFNVPLSIHYTLFDNFDIGAGLQFSRLTNAIGAFDTTTTIINGPNNTINTNAVKSFKGDALYQQIKTNEFRFLVDISYTYKHFIGGLRYNQALSKFVDIQVAPGQTTQGRNSSLQLYLRYILWDGRKKRAP